VPSQEIPAAQRTGASAAPRALTASAAPAEPRRQNANTLRSAYARGVSCKPLLGCARLQQRDEFIDRQAGLADECAEGALGNDPVIRDYEAPVRSIAMAKHDVAAPLAISLIPDPLERPDNLSPGDAGKLAQTATSTSSSLMDGGIGSPRALRLSR
jgi:hypothetical protein